MSTPTIILAATGFLIVKALSGDETAINPDQITSVTKTRDGEGNKLLTASAECVIGLTNGKFVTTKESCTSILHRIDELREKPP